MHLVFDSFQHRDLKELVASFLAFDGLSICRSLEIEAGRLFSVELRSEFITYLLNSFEPLFRSGVYSGYFICLLK